MPKIALRRLPQPLRIALATGFFLAFAWSGVPSVPAHPELQPTAEELALAGELTAWVVGVSEFHALREGDVRAALAAQRRDFELFAHGAEARDADAERRLLYGLPYGGEIALAASRHRLDRLLLAAMVEAESRFDAEAVSSRGAVGLLQVRPLLAGDADLFDPAVNLDVGARYFSGLLTRYGGDVQLALAAYNAGPAAVARHKGVPPYRETTRYIRKVLSIYADHERASQPAERLRLAAR